MGFFLLVNVINNTYVHKVLNEYTTDSILRRTPTNILPGASLAAVGDFPLIQCGLVYVHDQWSITY